VTTAAQAVTDQLNAHLPVLGGACYDLSLAVDQALEDGAADPAALALAAAAVRQAIDHWDELLDRLEETS
jgi:hypothetical protein